MADETQLTEEIVRQALRKVKDPEAGINIVDLGLVYSCEVSEMPENGMHRVEVKMTLTAPGCGMGDVIRNEVQEKVLLLPEVGSAIVELVFEPQWDRSMMSEEARLKTGLM